MGTLNLSFDFEPKNPKTIKKEYKSLMKKYSFYVVKFKNTQGVFYDLKKNKHKPGELVYTLYKDVIPAKQGTIDVSITDADEKPGLVVRQIKNYKELIEINIGKCSSTPMVVTTPKADEQILIAECKYTELNKPNVFCLVDDIDDPKIGDILYVTIDKRTSTKVNSREEVYTDYDAEVEIVDIKFYSLMNLPCPKNSLKRARTTLNKVVVKGKGIGLKVRTEDGFCCKAKCYLPNPEIGMKCILSGANDYVGNIEEFIQIDPNDSSLREIKELYYSEPSQLQFKLKVSTSFCIRYIYISLIDFYKFKISMYSTIYYLDGGIEVATVIGIEQYRGISKPYRIYSVQNHDSVIKLFACSKFEEVEFVNENTDSRIKKLVLTKCNYPEETLYLNDYFNIIGTEAFAENNKVKNVIINSSNMEFADRAFANSEISVIYFSKPVDLNLHAFVDCDSLEVTLPIEMYYLKEEIEDNFTTTNINVDFEMKGVADFGDYYVKDRYILAAFKNRDIEEFEVPLSITEIAENCFRNCDKLRILKTNYFVEDIGHNALLGCTSIESISTAAKMEVLQKAFGYDPRYVVRIDENNNRIFIPESLKIVDEYSNHLPTVDKTEAPEVLLAYARCCFKYNITRDAIDYSILAIEQGYNPAIEFLSKIEHYNLSPTPKQRNQMNRILHGFRDAFDTLVDRNIVKEKELPLYKKCDLEFAYTFLNKLIEDGGIDRVNLEKIYKHYKNVFTKELYILFYKLFKLLPMSEQSKYFIECAEECSNYPEFDKDSLLLEIANYHMYNDLCLTAVYDITTYEQFAKIESFDKKKLEIIKAYFEDKEFESYRYYDNNKNGKFDELRKICEENKKDNPEFYDFWLHYMDFLIMKQRRYDLEFKYSNMDIYNKYYQMYKNGDMLAGVIVSYIVLMAYPKFGTNDEHREFQAQMDTSGIIEMLNDLRSKGYHNKYKAVNETYKIFSYTPNNYIINGISLLRTLNGPKIPVIAANDCDIKQDLSFEQKYEEWQTYKYDKETVKTVRYVGDVEKLFNLYRPVLIDNKLMAFASEEEIINYKKSHKVDFKYDKLITPSMDDLYYILKTLSLDSIDCIIRGKTDTVSTNTIYEYNNYSFEDFKYNDEKYMDIDLEYEMYMKKFEEVFGQPIIVDFDARKYNMLSMIKYLVYSRLDMDDMDDYVKTGFVNSFVAIEGMHD